MDFTDYMMVAIIIVAIALMAIVLIQGQTSSGLGSVFGGTDIYRTRRGIEKTLFNATFILAGVFLLLCLLTVMLQNRI
ncbi:preprotein translocase subunit SecG [Chloroflexi bacterium TSY]|nr:preprotein translocase subunit SecG [Chloroflexi bacterium TSY]